MARRGIPLTLSEVRRVAKQPINSTNKAYHEFCLRWLLEYVDEVASVDAEFVSESVTTVEQRLFERKAGES